MVKKMNTQKKDQTEKFSSYTRSGQVDEFRRHRQM